MKTKHTLLTLSSATICFAALAASHSPAASTQDFTPWMIVTREKLEVKAPTWQWSALVPRNGGNGIFSKQSIAEVASLFRNGTDPAYRQMVESWSNPVSVIGGSWIWREDGFLISRTDPSRAPLQLGDAIQFATTGAGGPFHFALKADGTVLGWSRHGGGLVSPHGLTGIKSLASGRHILALRDDGTLLECSSLTTAPTVLASGLKAGAQVFATWSTPPQAAVIDAAGRLVWTNVTGLADRLKGRQGIKRLMIQQNSALLTDGTYLSLVPASLLADPKRRFPVIKGVVDVLNSSNTSVQATMLLEDGTFYLLDTYLYSVRPDLPWSAGPALNPALHRTASLDTDFDRAFVTDDVGDFGRCDTDSKVIHFTLFNAGQFTLEGVTFSLTGRDAGLFSIESDTAILNPTFARPHQFKVRIKPTSPGLKFATLNVTSTSPGVQPYVIPLRCEAVGSYKAVPASKTPAPLTFGPLHEERQTGLMVQTLTYTNSSTIPLPNGLQFTLSKFPSGVWVLGSHAPSTVNVVADPTPPTTLYLDYTAPVSAGGKIEFTICYSDASRRLNASTQPLITSSPLLEKRPLPGLLGGTLIPTLRVVNLPQGRMVEWNAPSRGAYGFEYSDNGLDWYSASTLLYAASARRMIWIDRGQPETLSKPTNRSYRIKKF